MRNRQELKTLGIHKLRDLARELGVKAPTTKRQSELIEEILKIECGEQEAVKSNMGRPPKGKVNSLKSYDFIFQGGALENLEYVSAFEKEEIFFGDKGLIGGINDGDECWGVIRNTDDKYYFRNYRGAKKYVVVDNLEQNFRVGSLVKGIAYTFSNKLSKAETIEEYKFESTNQEGDVASVVEVLNVEEMYDYILNDNASNKIAAEVEANVILMQKLSGRVHIHTEECEDLSDSYNMLLDVLAVIEDLIKQGKSFTLYLVDIEYIYDILYIYFCNKKVEADINAGQYFKKLISVVNNYKYGKIVLFEKKDGLRSSYLDMILNKFCKRMHLKEKEQGWFNLVTGKEQSHWTIGCSMTLLLNFIGKRKKCLLINLIFLKIVIFLTSRINNVLINIL